MSESHDGPWMDIKRGTFKDPRYTGEPYNPQELETFVINEVSAQYVKFNCTSFYGLGCVLQYIGVYFDEGELHIKLCLIYISSILISKNLQKSYPHVIKTCLVLLEEAIVMKTGIVRIH